MMIMYIREVWADLESDINPEFRKRLGEGTDIVVRMNVVVLLSALAVVSAFEVNKECEGIIGVEWKEDPTDCSVFYLCYNGRRTKYSCPGTMVTDPISRACVPKGSKLDKCSEKNTPSIPCNAALKESCAKYTNCPVPREMGMPIIPEVQECPYPLLYDEDSKGCAYPDTVKCGDRIEPKDPCDYRANQCEGPNCVPCSVRHPSCSGRPDGLNVWAGREKTPYFVVCRGERVVHQGLCPQGDKGRMFDPEISGCVDIDV
ncbi:hypothetical protein KP79_PYT12117 [Mizuhopecten yessoensis]|uniref:Chitin-binding type-2 domain-containing protein n=2 Tax=Mizuhopecten yessoensis TaxID=6573 RepID=A0A210Q2I8_MIZYE|nr:hypothetical protein KP79_PYT12117 [Mizuhopecten yessoensis]